ncbi:hypothetical protein SmJEL517_g02930 [Synchytrium microbalum]|uniref:CBF1-interacting co-repressor CIR N-terminal domain-containing protein n=1 Tax=Synchytrium microbalum TaxID=1806994 RepID=A0A507C5B1_9FUNG|nr:uncharacterized protein SmJEL517_g02930 [Synchytrium microbalum]TPX34309.1 hypothetical protein SmJEL517_g02930 [Synchytrium microbalum]
MSHILKHKSWHVYNAKNVEKVRKDEAAAQEEQDKNDARAQLAEQERRITLLRHQKQDREKVEDDHPADQQSKKLERFQLFDEPTASGANLEYEDEKRKEKEKQDRQYTMYLGQLKDAPTKAPWYMSNDPALVETNDAKDEERMKKEIAKHQREDPMASQIKKSSSSSKKHSTTSSPSSSSTGSQSFDIQRLRELRLKREAAERVKTKVLINTGKPPEDVVKHGEDTRFFHSQFNPDLVRRPVDRPPDRKRRHDGDEGAPSGRSSQNVRFS